MEAIIVRYSCTRILYYVLHLDCWFIWVILYSSKSPDSSTMRCNVICLRIALHNDLWFSPNTSYSDERCCIQWTPMRPAAVVCFLQAQAFFKKCVYIIWNLRFYFRRHERRNNSDTRLIVSHVRTVHKKSSKAVWFMNTYNLEHASYKHWSIAVNRSQSLPESNDLSLLSNVKYQCNTPIRTQT